MVTLLELERALPQVDPAPQLSPFLGGNTPGSPLYEYFKDNLPPDLPLSLYEQGLGCLGFARLIVGELGGPQKARIFYVKKQITPDKEPDAHAYVVRVDNPQIEFPYNNNLLRMGLLSVKNVVALGTDITEETLSSPWSLL